MMMTPNPHEEYSACSLYVPLKSILQHISKMIQPIVVRLMSSGHRMNVDAGLIEIRSAPTKLSV